MHTIQESEVAALVLGYLKKEKCHISYKYFYKQSPHLESYRNKKMQICTRYFGLSLMDILTQYSELLYIVQTKLDELEYFDNKSQNFMDLPHQLKYLLSTISALKSRASSPISRPTSPLDTTEIDSNLLSSAEKTANFNVSATQLHTLPGNTSNDLELVQEDNTASAEHPNITEDVVTDPISELDKSKCFEDATKAFLGVLLSDKELQEKIANNINDILSSSAFDECVGLPPEATASAVEAASAKTHSDPAFESLVSEILGTLPAKEADKDIPVPPLLPLPSRSNNLMNNHCTETIHIDLTSSTEPVVSNHANNNTNTSQTSLSNIPARIASDTSDKPLYFINTQVDQESTDNQSYIVSNSLTAQEIMTMPVYLCGQEDKQEPTLIAPPQPVPKKPQNLADFITMYKFDEDCDSPQRPSTSTEQASSNISVVRVESLPLQSTAVKTPESKPAPKVTTNIISRSGNKTSHVRNLDFAFQGTPGKSKGKQLSKNLSPKAETKGKRSNTGGKTSAKTLFQTAPVDKKQQWDSKFRAVLNSDAPIFSKVAANAVEVGKETQSPNENIDISNSNTKASINVVRVSRDLPLRKIKVKRAVKTPLKVLKLVETGPPGDKIGNLMIQTTAKDESGKVVSLKNLKKTFSAKKGNVGQLNTGESTIAVRSATFTETIVDPPPLLLTRKVVENATTDKIKPLVTSVFATPDVKRKPEISEVPMYCNDIRSMMETPNKDRPKTPEIRSPGSLTDTPLTRMFKEQTAGIDIMSLPTPKSLLTPTFAFTPYLEANETPHSNRPTDYSTSSSYYQPSDTEQNKSLEILIQECARLDQKLTSGEDETDVPDETVDSTVPDPTVVKRLNSLSKNVIARKNLNLMNKPTDDTLSSSSSSCSSSGSSTEDEDGDEKSRLDIQNSTVVEVHPTSNHDDLKLSDKSSCQSAISTDVDTQLESKKSENIEVAVVMSEPVTESNDSPLLAISDVNQEVAIAASSAKDTSSEGNKSADTIIQTKEVKTTPEVPSSCQENINSIVSKTDFVPALGKPDEAQKIVDELAIKRNRTIASMSVPPEKKKRGRKPKLPPTNTNSESVIQQPCTRTKTKTCRTLIAYDQDPIEPLEIVETELSSSRSNSPKAARRSLAESDDSEDISLSELMRRNTRTKRTKAIPYVKLESNISMFQQKQPNKKCLPPLRTRQKRGAAPGSAKMDKQDITTKKDAVVTKKEIKINKSTDKKGIKDIDKKSNGEEKLEIEKAKPISIDRHISTDSTLSEPLSLSVSSPPQKTPVKRKEVFRGTTGKDAETLVHTLKERGIELMPKPHTLLERPPEDVLYEEISDTEITNEPTTENDVINISESTNIQENKVNTFTDCPKVQENKIGRCITTIDTPEDELVFFDIQINTNPINVYSNREVPNTNKPTTNYEKILSKKIAVPVYADETDAEVITFLAATPFDCIFDKPSQIDDLNCSHKEPVKVLSNVLFKKEKSSGKTCSSKQTKIKSNPIDNTSAAENVKQNINDALSTSACCGSSILDTEVPNVPKNVNTNAKRKAEILDKDDLKKLKINEDDQKLLKGVDVDNFLMRIYKN